MCLITWTKLCTQVWSHGVWIAHTQQAQNIIKLWAICSIHIPPSHSFMIRVFMEFSTWNLCDDHDSGNISLGQPNFTLWAQAYTFYEQKKRKTQQCRERNPGSTLLHCQCNWETVISIIMSEGIKNKTQKKKGSRASANRIRSIDHIHGPRTHPPTQGDGWCYKCKSRTISEST